MKTATLWFFYYSDGAAADVTGTGVCAAPLAAWSATGDVVEPVSTVGAGRRHAPAVWHPVAPALLMPVPIDGTGTWTAPTGNFNGVGATAPRRDDEDAYILGLQDLEDFPDAAVAA